MRTPRKIWTPPERKLVALALATAACGVALLLAQGKAPRPARATHVDGAPVSTDGERARAAARAARRAHFAARADAEVRTLAALDQPSDAEQEMLDLTWEAGSASERLRERQAVVDQVIERRADELLARGVAPERLGEELEARYGELRERLVLGDLTVDELDELHAAMAEGARGFVPTRGDVQLDARLRAELGIPATVTSLELLNHEEE